MNTLLRSGAFILLIASLAFSACKKDKEKPDGPAPQGPRLIFRFAFDPDQPRLNNIGQPSTVPPGRAAQNPVFHGISAHYLELAQTAWTQLGQGQVLYHAPETTAGGATAIDFSRSIVKGEGVDYISIPLSSISPGTYQYMRVSLAYQNYDITVKHMGFNITGRVASFVGYNTYISSYQINTQSVPVNGNRLQGYWGFEADVLSTPYVLTGQAPEGSTTVPNPLALTSPIPAGSCVVTGPFEESLVITGNETQDIIVTLSLSINNSFEWTEVNADGFYEPAAGEMVVDMGLRGLIPRVN